MWGTLLAVWTVAGVTVKTAKSLGISSVRAAPGSGRAERR
jgi:hypothetical protein